MRLYADFKKDCKVQLIKKRRLRYEEDRHIYGSGTQD